MTLVDAKTSEPSSSDGKRDFPREVEFVISALEAGPRPPHERQQVRRSRYHVVGQLRLFSDPAGASPAVIYTRHVNPHAVGILTDRQLPLSHGGILEIDGPDGTIRRIACTIYRCRLAAPGWYEGALYFNREQFDFAADALESNAV